MYPPLVVAVVFQQDPDLSDVPCDYYSYAAMFSKHGAKQLPRHCRLDLSIQIKEGKTSPLGPIYSLSSLELQTLREFLDKNLRTGLIKPSRSPCGAPVLFVKKKDSSLRLCVDYRGLNKITCKDCYPIPLVADLLDAPKKARYYTKIDLRNAYHLVRIADGKEWKITFRMRYSSFE